MAANQPEQTTTTTQSIAQRSSYGGDTSMETKSQSIEQVGSSSGHGGPSVDSERNPSEHVEWVNRKMRIEVEGGHYTGLFYRMDKQGNILFKDAVLAILEEDGSYKYEPASQVVTLIPVTIQKSIHMVTEEKACTGEDLLENNWIGDLPEDILIHILSSLTLKEAGITSVLSKRWRHVWTCVPSLIFDASDVRNLLYTRTESEINEEEHKYFHWVDQVVNSHKGYTLDEFRVRYGLDYSRTDDIDRWLTFARDKGVKRLELDIQPFLLLRIRPYNFPNLKPWNQLTSLQLNCVEIDGGFLQNFLCDCQNLDTVSIMSAKVSLLDLKIVGPLKLKHLTLQFCSLLNHLEICAPNLISFRYLGQELLSSPFNSTPKLEEVSIGGGYADYLLGNCSDLSSCMCQIKELSLDTYGVLMNVAEVFPLGSRLKMLFIMVSLETDEPLFRLSSLIRACPFLQKLRIQILGCETDRNDSMPMEMTEERIRSIAFHHNHLKILEIAGFGGCKVETGFVKHLIRCAITLEKIIIQTDYTRKRGKQTPIRGREQAKLLYAVIKAGTELVVYNECGEKHFWSIIKE